MQRKDLALRVLSTAAIMSIVTSIAAPAFADIYYIGNGDINVETKTDENGEYVQVTQGGTTYKDESGEIVIKDGTSEKDATLKEEKRAEGTQAKPPVPLRWSWKQPVLRPQPGLLLGRASLTRTMPLT